MKYRRRIFFTDKQKSQIWDRWQRGESMSSIGRLFGRNSSSIYPLLARTGGIRPPERRRSRLAMTLAERDEISRGLKAKLSFRSIARQLRRAPSTISREVRRAHLGLDCAERVGHPLRQGDMWCRKIKGKTYAPVEECQVLHLQGDVLIVTRGQGRGETVRYKIVDPNPSKVIGALIRRAA